MYSSRLKVVISEKLRPSSLCILASSEYKGIGVLPVANPRTALGFLFIRSAIMRPPIDAHSSGEGRIIISML